MHQNVLLQLFMLNRLANIHSKVKYSPLAGRFLGAAAWSVIGSLVSSGISLIMLILVARLLGKASYGEFVVIQSTLNMVGIFAGFGIGAAATRYAAELKFCDVIRLAHILTLSERFILCFGLISSVVLVFSSGVMAKHILNASNLHYPLAISAFSVFFIAMDSYHKSVLIGFESMRAFAIGSVVSIVISFPIMLLAAKYFGLQGAAAAVVVNGLIQASISRFQMKKVLKKFGVYLKAKGCLKEWSVLWQFALPALISGVLVTPAHWATQAFLVNTPGGYTQSAILGVSMQWFNLIMFMPAMGSRVVLPILTDHVTKFDHSNSRRILLYAMAANAFVAIPMALIIGIFSKDVIKLYGAGFENDYLPLTLAVMSAALVAVLSPVAHLLAASSRMWLGAFMNAGWALVYVCVAYLLIGKGALGIMIALGISYIVHATWTFWYAWSHLNNLSKVNI